MRPKSNLQTHLERELAALERSYADSLYADWNFYGFEDDYYADNRRVGTGGGKGLDGLAFALQSVFTESVPAAGIEYDPIGNTLILIGAGSAFAAMNQIAIRTSCLSAAAAGSSRLGSVIHADKFKYMFGEVASGSHNTARTLQNVTQLNRIGIHNTPAGRRYLTKHLVLQRNGLALED